MSEQPEERRVFIKVNKNLFLEKYFGYFDSDKNREKLNNKIKTRRL